MDTYGYGMIRMYMESGNILGGPLYKEAMMMAGQVAQHFLSTMMNAGNQGNRQFDPLPTIRIHELPERAQRKGKGSGKAAPMALQDGNTMPTSSTIAFADVPMTPRTWNFLVEATNPYTTPTEQIRAGLTSGFTEAYQGGFPSWHPPKEP
jgi:hypothetical protein